MSVSAMTPIKSFSMVHVLTVFLAAKLMLIMEQIYYVLNAMCKETSQLRTGLDVHVSSQSINEVRILLAQAIFGAILFVEMGMWLMVKVAMIITLWQVMDVATSVKYKETLHAQIN